MEKWGYGKWWCHGAHLPLLDAAQLERPREQHLGQHYGNV